MGGAQLGLRTLSRSQLGRFDADHQSPFFTAIVDKSTYLALAREEIATL